MTTIEQRVYATLDAEQLRRVERIAAESGVSTKTARQILTRLVRTNRARREKLPGQGGPRGYQLRAPTLRIQ